MQRFLPRWPWRQPAICRSMHVVTAPPPPPPCPPLARVHLFPIVRSRQRCGECAACLNPHWKKACLTRRAEMEMEMEMEATGQVQLGSGDMTEVTAAAAADAGPAGPEAAGEEESPPGEARGGEEGMALGALEPAGEEAGGR